MKQAKSRKTGAGERQNSFSGFVAALRSKDPRIAEFAATMKSSSSGKTFESWGAVRSHLAGLGVLDHVLVGARLAWREYKKSRRFAALVE